MTEPHDNTVSTVREALSHESVLSVETEVSASPDTLSAAVHSPPKREYETSDIRSPRALNFLKRIAPPSRVISHARSFLPVDVKVTTIRTPPVIGESESVRPPLSEQATVRVPLSVASETCASGRLRSENDDGDGWKTASRSNQRKPDTRPSAGEPSEIRNLTEPTDGPSNTSQSPDAHEPHDEHPSFDRKSERPPDDQYRACSHEFDQTSVDPRNTFATATPSTISTEFVISPKFETSAPNENSGSHVQPKDEFVPMCQPSQRQGSSSG